MEEIRYKKFKGWNGTVYQVRMTHEEAEARRKLGLLIGILTVTPLSIIAGQYQQSHEVSPFLRN